MQAVEPAAPDIDSAAIAVFSENVKHYMSAAAGTAENAVREPGLLVTPSGIRAIRRYVSTALALRTHETEVAEWLGYEYGDIAGLNAPDIAELHRTIKEHARTWSSLESRMREVGSDLNVFSSDLVGTVKFTVEHIEGLESFKKAASRVGDLTLKEIEQLPTVSLADGDQERVPGILELINELKRLIERYRGSTQVVHADITQFKSVLDVTVSSEVTLKQELVRSDKSEAMIVGLQAEVDRVKALIEEKTGQYNSYSKKRWIGAFQPLTSLLSWSIYGVWAQEVYKERQILLAEKEQLDREVQRLDELSGGLETLSTSLSTIRIEIDAALDGANNLESMWSLLEKLISSTYSQVEHISSATLLLILVTRFKSLITNWESIKTNSNDLLVSFDKALSSPR